MMKHEFEALAGYEVSFADYNNIIEPMYMATNLDKAEFVKCIDKKRFALKTQQQLVAAIKKEAKHLFDICGMRHDYDSEERIERSLYELEERFGGIWYTLRGYELPELKRGCTFPETLIHCTSNGVEIKRYTLV